MSKSSANTKQFRAAKRPIDKDIIVVNQLATTSVGSTTLHTTTFPCTITGLRWSLGFANTAVSNAKLTWAIVKVVDGDSANTPSQSNGASMYQPEQNVLAFGHASLDADAAGGNETLPFIEGSTKTMRKMMAGDLLQFITIADVASSVEVDGAVQFFCKT